MPWMLDTNICIHLIRRRKPDILPRLLKLPAGEVSISAITLSELEFGVAKSSRPAQNRFALVEFLSMIRITEYDGAAAEQYGNIRYHLEKTGNIIGSLDLMIAADALSKGCILVTNNGKEFTRVPHLQVEDWIADQAIR